jgi:hypothetical protein
MRWQDAARELKESFEQKEPFRSKSEWAHRLRCSYATVDKAIDKISEEVPGFREWAQRPEAAPRAVGQPAGRPKGHEDPDLDDAMLDRLADRRELDPSERLSGKVSSD